MVMILIIRMMEICRGGDDDDGDDVNNYDYVYVFILLCLFYVSFNLLLRWITATGNPEH